jgi:hypothetical protein
MKARTTSFSITDSVEAAYAPAPLFANLLEHPRIADDIAGAVFLVIAAAPVALFLLLAAISPIPPACTDVPAAAAVTASSHAANAPADPRHLAPL